MVICAVGAQDVMVPDVAGGHIETSALDILVESAPPVRVPTI